MPTRAAVLCLVACSSAPPPAAPCPPAATTTAAPAPPPPHTVRPDVASDPGQALTRACGVAMLVLHEAMQGYQLLAHDVALHAELATKLDDPRATREATERMVSMIAGERPVVWIVATPPGKAVATSGGVPDAQLADRVIADGFTQHTHGVWKLPGQPPALVVGVPVARARGGRGVLVIGRALDITAAEHVARSADATVTIIGDGWRASSSRRAPEIELDRARALATTDCQPVDVDGKPAAIRAFADAFVVVTDAR